jgi:hypothetical protein
MSVEEFMISDTFSFLSHLYNGATTTPECKTTLGLLVPSAYPNQCVCWLGDRIGDRVSRGPANSAADDRDPR